MGDPVPLAPRRCSASHRLLTVGILTLAGFCALSLRLGCVQVGRHGSLAEAAVRQRAARVPLGPSRGHVLDRNGVLLSDSRLTYRIAVYPGLVGAGSPEASKLAVTLGLDAAAVAARLGDRRWPVDLVRGVGPGPAASAGALGLEGVVVLADEERYGPGALARHVVGYADGSGQGRDGLERTWDAVLGGSGPGFVALFVDGRGQPLPGLGWRKLYWLGGDGPRTSLPYDLVTTLDGEVQRLVEEVMDGRGPGPDVSESEVGPGVARGAVVVLDPRTGDILALASRPGFDPGDVSASLGRRDGPLLDRGVVAYPPGSVWKPVTLAAALESGVVRPGERFTCSGTVELAGRQVSCHRRSSGGHGSVSLGEALADSCNVVFAQLGERVGQDRLTDWAGRFGLGVPTGVGLPGESAGSLAPPEAVAEEPEVSFGQGHLLATPLQVACVYATIANGGRRVVPRLVLRLESPAGDRSVPGGPDCGQRVVSPFTAAEVTAALVKAVEDGTGRSAAVAADVAGKTGTAETGRTDAAGRELHAGWFAGFWPAHDPRFVVVVLIEDTRGGGGEAAEVFGEILTRILKARR